MDSPLLGLLGLAAGTGVLMLAAAIGIRTALASRRKSAFKRLAREEGLHLLPREVLEITRNACGGHRQGLEVVIRDIRYPRARRLVEETVIDLRSSRLDLPAFDLLPRDGSNPGDTTSGEVAIPGDAAFASRFRVGAPATSHAPPAATPPGTDADRVRALFDADLRSDLLRIEDWPAGVRAAGARSEVTITSPRAVDTVRRGLTLGVLLARALERKAERS